MNAHPRHTVRATPQADLFGAPEPWPDGFRYQPDLLTAAEEASLVQALAALPFEPFDFHGHLAKRQVVGFGYRYDYTSRQVRTAAPIPDFLSPLREKIAAFAGQRPEAFQQMLINEYRPGAGIGWHRDKPQFEEVVGVSLMAPCTLRFRRKAGSRWDRQSVVIEPRSAYLMTGPVRHIWEHSIPPVEQHRYSITLRTLKSSSPNDSPPQVV
jgi:alkylated DNA repair dioxygenase AlkB